VKDRYTLRRFNLLETPLMSHLSFESWPLNAQTAQVLGLPAAALTPTAELMANSTEWLWFEPAAQVYLTAS
jgi:hypothetical protein